MLPPFPELKVCADKPANGFEPSATGEGSRTLELPTIDSEAALIVRSPALPVDAPGWHRSDAGADRSAGGIDRQGARHRDETWPALPAPRVLVTISPLARIVKVPVLTVMSAAFAAPAR